MPWTPLHSQLHQCLIDRQLLPTGAKILLAVSGGQDSLCLGQLLRDLQSRWQWQLAIAHCDHGWAQDIGIAERVAQVTARWMLPFHCETTANLPETEAAAREWRYQALLRIAQTTGSNYLVTAHTQTDRAETLLYNLVRGAGADGLCAMSWQRQLTPEISLIRPLLAVNRAQTGEFCQEYLLPVWEDAYNQNLKYARNRLRLEIMPKLAADFNPQVESHLARTAELLRADVEYLESVAREWYQQALDERGIKIDRLMLKSIALSLQRRVIRQFLTQALGKMPTFSQIENTILLINAPNRTRTSTFSHGLAAEVSGKWIVVS
ncbi:tRNA lysidine(34) synthetase TilS [Chamaesiphon sp.]|uniref:tRNA lysidine(34) synthetase TilS n=1 Tax=Chamaesiphon sp. TaxID=2814140 RepID=UPI003593B4B5